MKILVANDDGINARGLRELAGALSEIGEIYISAPHVQRSASGHGISVKEPLMVKEVEFEKARLAYEMTGTPADCVKLGLYLLEKQGIKIDMVFSGINHGGNLGADTLYSGTVSAAIEGTICGYPSVAVSIVDHYPVYFETAAKLAVKFAKAAYGKMDAKTTLSINVPNIPEEEVKGLRVVALGNREYGDWFTQEDGEEGGKLFRYRGEPIKPRIISDNSDVSSIEEGYATVTPLKSDLTDYTMIEEVKKWGVLL